jgi:hypothetical protein
MQSKIQPDSLTAPANSGDPRDTGLIDISGPSLLELSWPTIVICALFIGMILASTTKDETFETVTGKVREFLHPRKAIAAVVQERALVITANPDREMQVTATISPRGFEAFPAKNLEEVTRLLAGHPTAPRLAVLDNAVHDADAISRLLRSRIPADRIVYLNQSTPRESIGPILLDRL